MIPAKRTCLLITASCLAVLAASVLAEQAPPAAGDEPQLLAVLESDAPLFDKAKACQRLGTIGTKAAVPVLAGLLSNEELSHYARTGLEPIPDPSVDEALRDAMGKLEGRLLAGVIGSVGMRRDAGAVGQLKEALGNSDAAVAAAAAWALGRIATPDAIAALEAALSGSAPLRSAAADACLTAADSLLADGKKSEAAEVYDALGKAELPKHLQIAALGGMFRARGSEAAPLLVECLRSEDTAKFRAGLAAAHEMPGGQVTEALVAELSELPAAAEAPGEILVIHKAEYGAGDKFVDVTDKLSAAVSNNGVSVTAGNQLAGDPSPGTPKQLRVTYGLGGQQKSVEIPEKGVFEVRGKPLPQHPRQALLFAVLGDRGDKAALPVVLEAAERGPWDIRLAAVRALARLGDVRAVSLLLETAAGAQGELAAAARDSLAALPGEQVDSAVTEMLAESEGQKRLVVVEMVGRRGIASAVPALMDLADGDDRQLGEAAVAALGLTVGLDKLGGLVDRLLAAKTPEAGSIVKEALRKACLRMPDRDASAAILIGAANQAPAAAKVDLLDLLGVVGGGKALSGVAAAAGSGDEAVQDAATRVLGEWMSADAGPLLLELATSGPEQFRVRCLRGYIRIPRQLDVPLEERFAMCRKALEAANRDDEKKLVLEVLARYPSAESLQLATPLLDQPGLKAAASAAAVAIAEKAADADPAIVAEAMKKAAEGAMDPEVANRAKALQRRAERKLRGN